MGVKNSKITNKKEQKIEPKISELPNWVFNVVHESWHNNPHLKRGEELEIKFITAVSEDMTNSI
ncbi:hypothetical protein ACS0TY_022110 [Phlomoides rotata]